MAGRNSGSHFDVRIGVIGTGNQWTENLAPAVRNAGVAPSVFVDSDIDKASRAAQSTGRTSATHTSDYREVVDEAEVWLLAGPPEMHEQIVPDLVERGKHVFVEKPPGLHPETLAKTQANAAKREVCVAVGHNFRFAPPISRLHDLLRGESRTVRVQYRTKKRVPHWYPHDPKLDFLIAHGSHPLDLVVWLAELDLKELNSVRTRVEAHELTTKEHSVTAVFDFQPGINASLDNKADHFELAVEADTGIRRYAIDSKLDRLTVQAGSRFTPRVLWERSPAKGADTAGFSDEIAAFLQWVRTGTRHPNTATLGDAADVLRLIAYTLPSSVKGHRAA